MPLGSKKSVQILQLFNYPLCAHVRSQSNRALARWHYSINAIHLFNSLQNRERFSERIANVADKVEHCDVHLTHGVGASVSGYLVSDPASSKPKEESALSKTTHGR